MAKQSLPVVYWDSCVFMDYLNGPSDDSPIVLMRNALIAKPKRVRIVTSTITIAEAALSRAEMDTNRLDPAVENKINALWEISSPIELVEVFAEVCHTAKQIARTLKSRGKNPLNGPDRIHVASALVVHRTFPLAGFHTGNGRLKRLAELDSDLVPFPICEPKDVSIPEEIEPEPATEKSQGLFGEDADYEEDKIEPRPGT